MMILKSRLFQTIILLFGIWVVNFFLIQLSPGDTSNLYLNPGIDRQYLETLRQQRGLDQPRWLQFKEWTIRLCRGDFGYSWSKHRPVSKVLQEAFPATLQLTSLALMLNFVLGCAGGAVAGIYTKKTIGRSINFLSLFLYALPTFWLALILILLFSVKLEWLPASQLDSYSNADSAWAVKWWDRIRHLLLPVGVLGLTGAAATARYVRSQMLEVLSQDYIRLAQAKGLPPNRVLFHHALKNALLPVVSLLGLSFPLLLSGAFVVEVIFALPGLGRVAYEALFAKDYPVIFAVNFFAAVMVIIGNLLADLLYRVVDPRVRA